MISLRLGFEPPRRSETELPPLPPVPEIDMPPRIRRNRQVEIGMVEITKKLLEHEGEHNV